MGRLRSTWGMRSLVLAAVVLAGFSTRCAQGPRPSHDRVPDVPWVFFDKALGDGRFVHVALSPAGWRSGRLVRMLSCFLHRIDPEQGGDGDGPFRAGWLVDCDGAEPLELGPTYLVVRLAPAQGSWGEVARTEDLAVGIEEGDR